MNEIKIRETLITNPPFNKPNVLRIFLYLLFLANHKKEKIGGVTVKKGQVLISSRSLSNPLKIPRQQVRTALKQLLLTHHLTHLLTHPLNNKTTLFTVTNYRVYLVANPLTNPPPLENKAKKGSVSFGFENREEEEKKVTKKRRRSIYINTTGPKDLNGHKKLKGPLEKTWAIDATGTKTMTTSQIAERLLKLYNQKNNTRYRTYKPLIKNLEYWLNIYTAIDMARAISRMPKLPFFKNLPPETIFRTRNKNGDCDYIGQMLNMKVKEDHSINSLIGNDD